MIKTIGKGSDAAVLISAAAAGIGANVILGASSLFWRALSAIPPQTLLCYRIVVSLLTLLLVMALARNAKGLFAAATPKVIAHHLFAAVLVAINWGTFIWASIHGHVVESGIGYLIAPFVAIAGGTLILGDAMSGIRRFAVMIIVIGVLVLFFGSGELNPAVYLVIGATWGGYSYLKKATPLNAFSGLFVETAILSIFIGVAVPFSSLSFRLPDLLPGQTMALLAACGLVSVIPLWLFSYAAKNLALSAMGFFQFVLPTTQIVVALVFYHQPLSLNTLVCFLFIWSALLLVVSETFFGKARFVGIFGRGLK